MKFKLRLLLFASVVGVACIIPGMIWSWIAINRSGIPEADEWMPWHIRIFFLLGSIILLFSITELSGLKCLRWIAIGGTTSMAPYMICLLLGKEIVGATFLTFAIGYSVLFIAAIVSIATTIASWLKERKKKVPTC
jgi:hypothetical protein